VYDVDDSITAGFGIECWDIPNSFRSDFTAYYVYVHRNSIHTPIWEGQYALELCDFNNKRIVDVEQSWIESLNTKRLHIECRKV
jgi:hypothetical protein